MSLLDTATIILNLEKNIDLILNNKETRGHYQDCLKLKDFKKTF